jgi:hypothetical protein
MPSRVRKWSSWFQYTGHSQALSEAAMSHTFTAAQVLDREFLAIRSRLIELAAALDRIDRAEGSVAADPRIEEVRRSLGVLSGAAPNRAEQVQMVFSLPYRERWREEYAV